MSSPLLRQPRWLVTHLLILVVSLGCVRLGLWQLDRLEHRRAENTRLQERLAAPALELSSVTDLSSGAATEELEYRRVQVTGTYRTEEEVLQRSRAHRGENGYHVLTPLVTDGGAVLLVRRGWVPYRLDEPPVRQALPPDGEVTVRGYLETSEEQSGFGPTDPEDGRLARVFRADVARLDRQVSGELWPMLVHLESQVPPPGELPRPAPRPEFDEANHLSYALQWFSFAVIAIVGYALAIRSRRREGDGPATDREAGARPTVASG